MVKKTFSKQVNESITPNCARRAGLQVHSNISICLWLALVKRLGQTRPTQV